MTQIMNFGKDSYAAMTYYSWFWNSWPSKHPAIDWNQLDEHLCYFHAIQLQIPLSLNGTL